MAMPSKVKIGDVYGDWTVIGKESVLRHKEYYWVCKCICGNERGVRSSYLREGRSKSCGCAQVYIRVNGRKPIQRTLTHTWHDVKGRAKSRGLEFSITLDDFARIINMPCYYCGEKDEVRRGIDRADNALGYTPDNCLPCCWDCNRAKGTMANPGVFKEWIQRAYHHLFGASIA